MVDEEHLGSGISIRPIDTTVESGIRHIKRSLPDIGELCTKMSANFKRELDDVAHHR